ncbi:MAG TPA: hypothetical protein DD434_14925 [Bacteroidales bacterium]|nr:hypothetical protein [Bacteroidales bacterium]
MNLTIKIFKVILVIILIASCNKEEYADVKCFKEAGDKENYCFFYDGEFNNGFSEWGFSIDSSGHLKNAGRNWKHDTSFPTYFIKKKINFDTIFYASEISSLHNEWYVFNAIITKDEWDIGLYYPYIYEGHYKFKITESEQYLLNHAVSLISNVKPFISPRQKDFNKVDADFLIFLRIISSKISKEYFADMDNQGIDSRYYFITNVIQTIVSNHIKPGTKISATPRRLNDKHYKKYERYFITGSPPPPID